MRLLFTASGLPTDHTDAERLAAGGRVPGCWCRTCQPGIFPKPTYDGPPPYHPKRTTLDDDEEKEAQEDWRHADAVYRALKKKR